MAQPGAYWGFISPDGGLLLPEPEDEHHRDISRRILPGEGLTPNASRLSLLKRDYIAFEVSELGYCELIGGAESSDFRRRVLRFLNRTPGIMAVDWWFDIRGKAGSAESAEDAAELLLIRN